MVRRKRHPGIFRTLADSLLEKEKGFYTVSPIRAIQKEQKSNVERGIKREFESNRTFRILLSPSIPHDSGTLKKKLFTLAFNLSTHSWDSFPWVKTKKYKTAGRLIKIGIKYVWLCLPWVSWLSWNGTSVCREKFKLQNRSALKLDPC